MSISASHIVALSSRVIAGGGNDLETNGLLLTKSALLPTGTPAMLFSTAEAVSELFGPESDEAAFAQQYFTGVTNAQAPVRTLVIGRRIDEDAAAWIRGGSFDADLAALKAVTDGALKITVDGSDKTATSVDLSEATSLSQVAEIVATAITGVTGSYDSNTNTFTFTSSTKGETSTIGYASAGDDGTDLSAMLGLTKETGAVLSQGAVAQTETQTMDTICEVTRNWVGFTTIWETELEEAKAFAAWTDATGDDYCYFDWSEDENQLNQLTQESTKAAQLMGLYNCTAFLYGDWRDAAFALAVGASIAWNRTQGMKTWFAKTASGITPRITNESAANALEAIRVNYTGDFATRNDQFTFFNRGTLASDLYGFIDVLYGSIYLRSAIQTSCMAGFQAINRSPYNARGEAFIRAWCQDPINRCLNNGVIDTGLELNESQRMQILNETGSDDVLNDLYAKGYWIGVSLPDAAGRADREEPIVTVYYCYAGSIQRLDCEVTAVI
jgi:hypothetical protein